jgi:PhnB protein
VLTASWYNGPASLLGEGLSMNTVLLPYLNFMGKTAEAMRFYQSIFGGSLAMQTFAEAGIPTPPETKDNVIHAELKTPDFTFMSSDGDTEHPVTMGNSVNMSLIGTDEQQLTEYFNRLAEGGTITLPLAKQFWGDTYGQLTDKFGIHWMVNIGTAGMEEQK